MNPDTTPDSFPEILQAEWDHNQVLALFADLAEGAEVEHVQLRTDSDDATVTLSVAKQAFDSGRARAVQVRYRFENELWSDTILPGDPTTKIIRSRLPE
ncbi:MAG: hypothetical protein KDB00_23920 [Planctomycetales bacterium]|nr:hypothetical protein [Planctomycetales bacterium]